MYVNFIEIAKQLKSESGEMTFDQMPRLCEVLHERGTQSSAAAEVTLTYALQGLPARFFAESALPMLQLQISTILPMVCQRCFEPLPSPLTQTFLYALCDEPPEALLEDETVEWLDLETSDIHALIEDELLMALPIAVLHTEICVQVAQKELGKPNPFAILQQLKQREAK